MLEILENSYTYKFGEAVFVKEAPIKNNLQNKFKKRKSKQTQQR